MENKIIICEIYYWECENISKQYIDGYQFIVDKGGYHDIWQLSADELNDKQAELLQKYFAEENFTSLEMLLRDDFGIRLPTIDETEWLELLKRN